MFWKHCLYFLISTYIHIFFSIDKAIQLVFTNANQMKRVRKKVGRVFVVKPLDLFAQRQARLLAFGNYSLAGRETFLPNSWEGR